ncbi:MAG: 50S ribosomal protein L29 [Gemmataceae bacterium]
MKDRVKSAEFRLMTDEQLNLHLKDTIKNLFHLRCQAATEKLDAPSEIKHSRREIARIKTIMRERELAQLAAEAEEKELDEAHAQQEQS